jgi:DNA (cytosine-5)-methyltransferase 1
VTLLTCLEIFAGAGGQALGLEQAGFIHQAVTDIDADACETLRANRPQWNIIEADIRKLRGADFRGVDLLSGSLPSLQLGAQNERNLFPDALRLIAEVGPRAVLLDSVRALTTDRFANYRRQITDQLGAMGYSSWWHVLQASDFGVPQLRSRCVIVAITGWSASFQWPYPAPFPPPTVAETLHDLMSARGWAGADSWRRRANGIAPPTIVGSSRSGGPDLGPNRSRQAWLALGIDGRGIADEAPGPDFPPGQLPRLTIRMAARLQGFPDTWMFTGRKTAAFRQVSSATPPPVAKALGEAIKAALNSPAARRVISEPNAPASVRRGSYPPLVLSHDPCDEDDHLAPDARVRKEIDKQLAAAGWTVQSQQALDLSVGPGVAVPDFAFEEPQRRVDYVLFLNGQPAGVIEAKSDGTRLGEVEHQSGSHVEGLPGSMQPPIYPLPFIYQSTGAETRFVNGYDPKARSRWVFTFHRPETLAEWARQIAENPGVPTFRARLKAMPPLDERGLRGYQAEAIRSIEKSLAGDRPRMLVQMAAGSGKVFTAVNLSYRLIRHAGARRILFLVDRSSLGVSSRESCGVGGLNVGSLSAWHPVVAGQGGVNCLLVRAL